MRYSTSFIAVIGLLLADVYALEELPLGSTKAQLIAAYGQPDPPPIMHILGPRSESPPKEKVDGASYRSLKPERDYWIENDHTTAVHYNSLKGITLDSVMNLLAAHAEGEKITEVPPKEAGWTLEGASAWRCKAQGWIAFYRPEHKDTLGSLLINIEPKDNKPKQVNATMEKVGTLIGVSLSIVGGILGLVYGIVSSRRIKHRKLAEQISAADQH